MAGEGGTEEVFVLAASSAQRQLWFLEQLQPSAAYNVPYALRLAGPLHRDALEAAVRLLVGRHESLRTTFDIVDGEPVQIIAATGRAELRLVDLSDRKVSEVELDEQVRAELRVRFDLKRGPLVRATLFRLSAEDHLLLLSLHHIIVDAWSLGILAEELSRAYSAYRAGREPELLPLAIQYADYAQWQGQLLESDALDEEVAYWKQKLAGHPPALELLGDRPRPANPSFAGATHWITLPNPLVDALQAIARREGATLFMVVTAALAALLSRRTGQTDLLFGTPTANRDRPELEAIVGYFVNSIVLRLDLSGSPSLRQLLSRTRETALDAFSHKSLPFDRVVQAVRPERNRGHAPLFQVFVQVFGNDGLARAPQYDGLRVHHPLLDKQSSPYDLNLNFIIRKTDGLFGYLEYNTDLFDANTIAHMAEQLVRVLGAMAADLDRPLEELTLLGEEDRRTLTAWNATRHVYPSERPIHVLIEEQARRTPEAVAVTSEGEHLSYRELDARSNQLARHLRRRGVGPEVLVGVCMERSIEMMVALLGVLKAGGAYVPLDPGYPTDRLAYMVADAGSTVLLTQARLRAQLPAHEGEVLCIDSAWPTIAEESPEPLPTEVGPESLAYVIYTSGSTGRPKGAMNRHAGVRNRLQWMQAEYKLGPGDVVLQKTPFSFDVSVWELFWPLMTGARLVMARPEGHKDPRYLTEVIAEEGVTTLHFVPSMLSIFLEERELASHCATVRQVMCSGEALPRDLEERFFQRMPGALHNLYGPTEAAVDVTAFACAPGRDRSSVPIGRPIANTQIHVLDSLCRPVPLGTAGELYIGGVQVGRGYWRRPELTAEKFVPNPLSDQPGERMYRTGDLTRWRTDGTLEYLGRIDHQVKIRGFRIELGEIESALLEQPGVRDAVVVPRDDQPGGPRLVAYVVGPTEQLLQALRRRLPEHMVPSVVVSLERMPLSPSGKVERRALPAPTAEQVQVVYVEPSTETERRLAALWAELFRLPRIGRHDNFYALGGHSLLFTRLLSRVREVFGVELPFGAVYGAADLDAVAAAIDAARPSAESARIQRAERRPLMPASREQVRMWNVCRDSPGDPFFHTTTAQLVRGLLDVERLERALRDIVRRHETLRTALVAVEGVPMQAVRDEVELALRRVDLSDLPEATRWDEARKQAAEEVRRPFALEVAPLFRALLIELTPREHVLVLTLHHAMADAQSLGFVLKELGVLYSAGSGKGELPELTIQYADYAIWQQGAQALEGMAEQVAYWRKQLAGCAPLEVPGDFPRTDAIAGPAAMREVLVSETLTAAMNALAHDERSTLFTALLAAYKTLLWKYTGRTDLVVGIPLSSRRQAETAPLVGYFINHLPLRTDLAGDPSFRELLRRQREVVLGAFSNKDVELREMGVLAEAQTDLLYRLRYNMLGEAPPGRIGDLELSMFDHPGLGTSRFDLAMYVVEKGKGLRATLRYRADLFSEATVDRLLADYLAVITAATVDPDVRLSRIELGPIAGM